MGVNRVLAALFLATFVLGSAEMLVVGLLGRIAEDLRVPIPAAGGLVTAYALGLALGGPVLTAVTIRWNRRRVLLGALLLAVLGVVVPILTAGSGVGYALFVAARVATGALAGLMLATAFVVGTAIVEPARAGRAISAVFSGVAVSGALGVPLGTLAGEMLGWRGAFAAVALLGIVAWAALAVLLPSLPGTTGGVGAQLRYALAPRVLAVLALHVLVFGALYAAVTYIAPFLKDVTGVSGPLVSVFLLAYGVANAVGSLLGGRFADRDAARTLLVGAATIAAALLALHTVGAVPALVGVMLAVLGLVAASMVPSLQYRVMQLAGPGGALAQSLPAAAANVGVAAGVRRGWPHDQRPLRVRGRAHRRRHRRRRGRYGLDQPPTHTAPDSRRRALCPGSGGGMPSPEDDTSYNAVATDVGAACAAGTPMTISTDLIAQDRPREGGFHQTPEEESI